jgi:hypothetical protein
MFTLGRAKPVDLGEHLHGSGDLVPQRPLGEDEAKRLAHIGEQLLAAYAFCNRRKDDRLRVGITEDAPLDAAENRFGVSPGLKEPGTTTGWNSRMTSAARSQSLTVDWREARLAEIGRHLVI